MEQLLGACQNMGQDRWWFAVEDRSANSFMTAEHFSNEKLDIFDCKVSLTSSIEVKNDAKDLRLRDGWSIVDHIVLTWILYGTTLELPRLLQEGWR